MEFTNEQRDAVEAALKKHTEGKKAITSGNLFDLLTKQPVFAGMDLSEFKPKLSRATNSDELSAYEGVRKVGYRRRIGPPKVQTAPVVNESSPQPETKTVNVGKGARLRFSEGCWSIEKLITVGEGQFAGENRWVAVPSYHASLLTALEALLTRHACLLGVQPVTELKSTEEVKELLKTIRDGIAEVKLAVMTPTTAE